MPTQLYAARTGNWVPNSTAPPATGYVRLTYADFAVGVPPQTPPPPTTVLWGVSASIPDVSNFSVGTTTYAAEVARQVADLGAQCFFNYFGPGEAPHWAGEGDTYPASADVFASTKVADPDAIAAYVSQIPARAGRVFLHYWQEPEDEILNGVFTLQQYRDATAAVHSAIPPGHPVVTRAQELTEYHLRVNGSAFMGSLIVPTTEYVAWSLYADTGGLDPVASVRRIETFMTANAPGVSWGIAAVGYPLPPGWSTAQAQARVNWFTANADTAKATACQHYGWFDSYWASGNLAGDYRIANDPLLLAAWHTVTGL